MNDRMIAIAQSAEAWAASCERLARTSATLAHGSPSWARYAAQDAQAAQDAREFADRAWESAGADRELRVWAD